MNNKDMMIRFINNIRDMGMLTEFIKYIFNYKYLDDHNYIFRIIDDVNSVIIDIYDNVSNSRFNRYIYDFDGEVFLNTIEDYILVKKISIKNLIDNDDKILKLGYLFKLDKELMVNYAKQFMNTKFVQILECIIKNKPI